MSDIGTLRYLNVFSISIKRIEHNLFKLQMECSLKKRKHILQEMMEFAICIKNILLANC